MNVTPEQLAFVRRYIQEQERKAVEYFDRAEAANIETEYGLMASYTRRGNACLDVARGMRLALTLLGY